MTSRRARQSILLVVLLVGVACAGGATTTTGGTSEPSGSSSASPSDTSWSFTDDEGVTVTLDSSPDTIVAYEDVAATLLDFGIRPAAVFGTSPIAGNPLFEGYDMSGIESVGEVYGEINIEKTAALAPDLIISMQWDPYGTYPPFGFNDYKQLRALNEVAPVISIMALRPAPEVLERYVELADALGADLESSEMSAKRDRYEEAKQSLLDAAASRPDVSVIGYDINSVADGLFVAQAIGFPDLWGYQDIFGITFVQPQSEEIIYWEQISPENTDRYLADVILYDSREPALPFSELEDGLPLWNDLPAVEAGQIVPWYVPGSGSYTRDADAMELLAEAIANAEDVA